MKVLIRGEKTFRLFVSSSGDLEAERRSAPPPGFSDSGEPALTTVPLICFFEGYRKEPR